MCDLHQNQTIDLSGGTTLPDDVTRDAFLGGQLELLQPATGYRAGLDAVVLAATLSFNTLDEPTLLDCGAGVGTVGLCAATRCSHIQVVLVDCAPDFIELAQQNIHLNGLDNRVRVLKADITAPGTAFLDAGIKDNSFSYVVANPPFYVSGRGTTSPNALKAGAHEMDDADLDQWVRFMARMAKADGQLVMIQHVASLPSLLKALEGRFGGTTILPVHPREGAAANRVIVAARKGSRAPLKILSGFVLHDANNAFTTEAEAVLKDGAALEFFENGRT